MSKESVYQFGEKLRQLRKSRNMSQEQLAEKISDTCSSNMISRYESGQTIMNVFTYFDVCNALGCTYNELAPDGIAIPDDRVEHYHQLTEKNKEIVQTMVQALILQQACLGAVTTEVQR